MPVSKGCLRRTHLQVRDSLGFEARIEGALSLAEHAGALQNRLEGRIVSAYHPIRSEIDPRPLMAALSAVRWCLPAIIGRTELQFRALTRTVGLVDGGGFGTVAPPESAAVVQPEAMLMPLSVFDRHGGRIGYGGGFYDRAIESLHNHGVHPLLVGLAFDEQEADCVPQEAHDIALNLILTPTRWIACNL